MFELEFHVLS